MAVNDLIAVKGPKDISGSLRKLDRLKEKDSQKFQLAHAIDLKLSPKQKEKIYANRVLLLLHANKMDQVSYFEILYFSLVVCIVFQPSFLRTKQSANEFGSSPYFFYLLVKFYRLGNLLVCCQSCFLTV